eukprot:scaffold10892_cov163-Amphora_coffeaeformis.AAC.6
MANETTDESTDLRSHYSCPHSRADVRAHACADYRNTVTRSCHEYSDNRTHPSSDRASDDGPHFGRIQI